MTQSTPGADGRRIAELLASELVAREDGPLARCSLRDVRDADTLEPGEFGAFAYAVHAGEEDGDGDDEAEGGGDHLADVYVHDDRGRVEFRRAQSVAAEAGGEADLRVRPKAVEPPRTLVFVEDTGQVKRVLPVFEAALAALDAA
ncbi:hypothetical protein [Halomarina litorea]|uniref:hypothetical protein n=1 Tax=Halomarina litorea TaxID=2961595 RepID=UPI0020C486EB|nr:hypothetical protein [Halomarina sp. BCD28]